jgi:anti-sigma regulatory factor (Ser/Thr protein kinase)
MCQHACPVGDLPALLSRTARVLQKQHMAGDNFPTHAHRGGWATGSGHRDRAAGLYSRTRFAPTPGPTSDFRLTVPALPENVAVVRRLLECVAGVHEMPASVVEDVRLAVTEACTNVVRHAYEEGEGAIDVVVKPRASSLEVVISDEGRGMGPSPDTNGPGLGLPLISALASSVDLRPGRRGGSRLTLTFSLERA